MKSKDIMKAVNNMSLGHFVLKINTDTKIGNYVKYTYSVYIIQQEPVLLTCIERVIQGMTPEEAYKVMDTLLLELFFKYFKYGTIE